MSYSATGQISSLIPHPSVKKVHVLLTGQPSGKEEFQLNLPSSGLMEAIVYPALLVALANQLTVTIVADNETDRDIGYVRVFSSS